MAQNCWYPAFLRIRSERERERERETERASFTLGLPCGTAGSKFVLHAPHEKPRECLHRSDFWNFGLREKSDPVISTTRSGFQSLWQNIVLKSRLFFVPRFFVAPIDSMTAKSQRSETGEVQISVRTIESCSLDLRFGAFGFPFGFPLKTN